jgi:hypothetical protein
MQGGALLRRLSAMGASAQASVPGLYAWGVTVAPAAWAHGGSWVAKVAALTALAFLVGGVAAEGILGERARVGALWGFVLGSALTWSAAPAALAVTRVDAPRGIAGMLGWGLFAFASAAPAVPVPAETDRVVVEPADLAPRRGLKRGDAAYVVVGAVLAGVLQVFGWQVAGAERSLLVRFVALAAGLASIGAWTEVGLARHRPRARLSPARRVARALVPLVLLSLLGASGLLFVLRG